MRNKEIYRNEIKSYIIRAGMTMSEAVEILADEYGWSSSVPNLSDKLKRGAACATARLWSWPMCWGTTLFGKSAGR